MFKDISAQKMSFKFQKYAIYGVQTIHFVAQDHFSLDVTGYQKQDFTANIDFSLMVLLQQHKDFAFKPFSPILTLSKESKIISYEKQTPENYIMFISSMCCIYNLWTCVLYRFCIHTLMLAIQSFWVVDHLPWTDKIK